ncbi:MAG: DUF695 domain-containing protein [Pedococcus sp.]
MGIFRRSKDRSAQGSSRSIEGFWAWWATEGRTLAEASIAGGANDALVAGMGQQVSGIHPGLAWEFSPGATATHCLVVSPEGDAILRAPARRWLKAAPAADATWEFADSRQANPDAESLVLQIGDQSIAFADVVVGARRESHRVDVSVHHPAFRTLDDRGRVTIAFLALDNALGETDVELWVGEVSPSQVAPLDGFGLAGLRAVVRDLKAENTDDRGQPSWAILSGDGEGGPVLAMTQVPLASATAPELDTHAAVVVPYADQTETGLPGPEALTALRSLEDSISEALGGTGRVVAHQSHAGVRVLHVYVDSTTDAVPVLTNVSKSWPQDVRIQVTPDPGWANVAHLRT